MLGWAVPIAVPGLGDSPLILTHQVPWSWKDGEEGSKQLEAGVGASMPTARVTWREGVRVKPGWSFHFPPL